jgi:hypothetical protein
VTHELAAGHALVFRQAAERVDRPAMPAAKPMPMRTAAFEGISYLF